MAQEAHQGNLSCGNTCGILCAQPSAVQSVDEVQESGIVRSDYCAIAAVDVLPQVVAHSLSHFGLLPGLSPLGAVGYA
eukprot:6317334-Amphidinium_carterae.1